MKTNLSVGDIVLVLLDESVHKLEKYETLVKAKKPVSKIALLVGQGCDQFPVQKVQKERISKR